jgi:folate-binding protein YgfZ
MPNTLLDRAVIKVTGEDAEKLLNDTLTGRLSNMERLAGRWWALLSPQGKVLAEGLATVGDGAIWLDLHPSIVENFLKRMRMYRLRAKVEFENVSDRIGVVYAQGGVTDHPDTPWYIPYGDERGRHLPTNVTGHSLGMRFLVERDAFKSTGDRRQDYDRERIAAGITELGPDFGPEEVFAHDIGMDILDGIDFAKGCYVGQEVVSRMKHRGTARRRPVVVTGIDAAAGSAVSASGRDAGTIGAVVDGTSVAILRLDRVTDPSTVTIDGKSVGVALPVWATYAFGDSVPED